MKKLFFLLLSLFITVNLLSQQNVNIRKPMYGEAEKNENFKKLDDDFRKTTLEKYGSADSAVVDLLKKAWAYFCQNDLETAMIRFNQAWLLNPEYPDPYFGFAALLEMQKNNTEANRFYKMGVEKDKGNRRAINCFQHIGNCKEQLNDVQGALTAYTKISLLKPNDSFIYKKMGFLQMKLGNDSLALKAYEKAIELDPNDPVTFYNRAYIYQTTEAYGKAISDYTRCIILDSTYLSAYKNRGILEMKRGLFEFGQQDFETGIRLDNTSSELWRLLGLAKLSLNDTDGACENFKSAKELGDAEVEQLINEYCK